ncbi:hypothetical protein IFM89_008190 [Coptis chinensis]|uniref:Transcription initiation factor IIA subunit 2 n=1 Tax=Coptis chinensis TaxID=261450 RepID=A0A835HY13_9MAGN|nr:hypothetical protein IFM89_008190 [Coptis chinensis]
MATFELYRRSTIGMCLTETLDEMVSSGTLSPELAIQVLVQFDKSMTEALETQVKSKVTVKFLNAFLIFEYSVNMVDIEKHHHLCGILGSIWLIYTHEGLCEFILEGRKMVSDVESVDSNRSSVTRQRHEEGITGCWGAFVRMGYFSEANLRGWSWLTPGQRYRRVLHDFLLAFPQNPDVSWCWRANVDVGIAEELMWGCFVETVVLAESIETTEGSILSGHMRELINRMKDLEGWQFDVNFLKPHLYDLYVKLMLDRNKENIAFVTFRHAQYRVGSGADICLDAAGHLHTYRFCDNVWTFILQDAVFKNEECQENVGKVKIVACDSKLLTQ